MILSKNIDSIVKVNENMVIKKIYDFLKLYYNDLKVISIKILDDDVYLYIDQKNTKTQKLLVQMQQEIKKYIFNEYNVKIKKVNIITL